ncbi:MAG: AAA family ATPase [Planctomycetes bacterium]|nr:AAA family ATPase [Planctomycetota bacterium]
MSFSRQLDAYFRSRCTLIVIATTEEERALEEVMTACSMTQRKCLKWDLALGLREAGSKPSRQMDPRTLLETIASPDGKVVYVLHDFHEVWREPSFKRQLRSLAQTLRTSEATIVVTIPKNEVPDELKDEAVIVDLPIPDEREIDELLARITSGHSVSVNLNDNSRRKLVQAALGLTVAQARRAFSEALISSKGLNEDSIQFVLSQKKQVLRQSEALEFYSSSETMDNVGGLDKLKGWLRDRECAFSKEAADYGLPAPRGVVLLGIPGTGKSLTAKMVSGLWQMPLLRLDVGALFGSYVGQSEERLRRAIHLAETVAPCVLWIDELEKGFAQGGLDGGTSQRVFGSLLSWMQDKRAPVFIVATANDVSSLPPELLRRGRFDEIFFLDLPTQAEREDIIKVHLKKKRRKLSNFDTQRIAAASTGFVGAEIEQAISDAMYTAFNDGCREVTTGDIVDAVTKLVPLSKSQREKIDQLQKWLREGRAQSASSSSVKEREDTYLNLEFLE